ncbi:O-antigen ligase domain-containing protein [Clostridium chromiireducens]|uniref:O-antigen ligase domain-containing protein n=1 Tax=Clostridium chromiireducens TaxID=225345 RepID=A0A964RPG8_9CLOT|nr:O-antigen ligase family protein [Clostridium chromiireducens]MVX65203.1 O-antigen ligase domain-containing protein [Clostridium chromiireducens]
MTKEDIIRNSVLAIVFAISGFIGIASGNYLITAMYILTVAGAVIFVLREKDLYSILYAVLLVSAFYDYSLYVPGIENVYMFHIVLGVFSLLSLYKAFKDRDVLMTLDKKVLAIYVIWFVYACASITWALNRSLSIKYIAIYLMMFAFIVDMMIYNINGERIKKTINLLLFLISLVIIIGIVEVLLGQQLPIKHYYDSFRESLPQWQINTVEARPIAFSFNTNNLTATLAIMAPISLFAIYKFENIFAKLWFTLVSCIAFSLVVVTTSRTGFFAFLFGFAVFIIYSILSVKKLGIRQMIFPIILVAGFALAYNYSTLLLHIKPVEGNENLSTSLSGKLQSLEGFTEGEITSEGSTLHRMEIIKTVVNGVIKDKKYQGYSVGNVEQLLKERGNTGSIYSPHAYPIEILGDFGLPGIALYGIYYLYLLIGNLITGIKKKSVMCFAAVAGLIAFAPASFGPSSITYVFSHWILMGFAVSCMQAYRKERNGFKPTSSMKEYRMI